MMLLLWISSCFIILAQGQVAENRVCPSLCLCRDKLDNGGLFKVECNDIDIDNIRSLNIPTVTTQLSITMNPRLSRIGKDDLSSLVNLDRLNLSSNGIESIESEAFKNLQTLTKLDLSNNKLASINNTTFDGLIQLKRLSLSGNQLTTLPEKIFTPLTQLEKVDFQSEQFVCDCHLKWIIQWMEETGVNIPDTKCSAPDSLKGVFVKSLTRETLPCDWPVDLRIFEIQPSNTQLVFAGDPLQIDCTVSIDSPVNLYWYRQGKRVNTNSTRKIQVSEDRGSPGLLTLILKLEDITVDSTGSWSCVAETGIGNVTKAINLVVSPVSCPAVTMDSDRGEYSWPRTGVGSRSELPCIVGESGAKAFYTCNSVGKWVDLNVGACKFENQVTQLLHALSLSDFTDAQSLDKVKLLMDMLVTPSTIADKMAVVFVARVLRQISSAYDLYTIEDYEIPQMVFNITSLMMNVDSSLLLEAEKLENSCTSMMENLETVVDFVLHANTDFNIYTDNIALAARRYHTDSFIGLTCTVYQTTKAKPMYIRNNLFCQPTATAPDLVNIKNQRIDAVVHIPAEAAISVRTEQFKLAVIIYRNDQLFKVLNQAKTTKDQFVPSSVISTSIIGAEVKSLASPVMIALPRVDYAMGMVPKVHGVYWETTESLWKTDGCRLSNTVEQDFHNLSVIECEHMTSYSLLQERPVSQAIIEAEGEELFIVMRPQFYVGASFLCLCLLIIIFTYTCFYRTISLSKKLKHSLVNTCVSILLLKLLFIFGVRITNVEIACKVIGMAIHYFSITTIFWMTVTTWNIYKKITGKGHHHPPPEDGTAPLPPNPMLKFYLFAWGIPIIICGITGAVNINFYSNKEYCFVAWKPGLLAFYGVVGLFVLINFILYICICSSKHNHREKGYMHEMMVLNADGCIEPQPIDDSMSHTGSIKSSIADNEYQPLAQLTGIVLFLVLYILMWTSGAFSIDLPFQTNMELLDVILSFLYMVMCIILGIFLVVFYCLARNDTRASWYACFKPNDYTSQPPRSNTNINVITHANAHNSLRRDDDSNSSLKDSSVNNQSNPLLQIMQYHKKTAMMSHSAVGSQSKAATSIHSTPEDAPLFFNPRQNGVAKRYWEKKRTSRERGMDNSMLSVPENSRLLAHSPTNTEPTQHMSIEIQIKSHSSKQARRHRLGSTNSEPADVRNNIYHSMPKTPAQHLNMPNRPREPTIGQSKTSSEGGGDVPQFYRYPPEMWQSSVPRNYNHIIQRSNPHVNGYMRQPSLPYERAEDQRKTSVDMLQKQSYVHSYIRSMKEVDCSDDESHHSHRSRRSSQRSRHRHRHRHHQEGEGRQLMPSTLNESYMSLQSHSTARSHHSSRSGRSHHRQRSHRGHQDQKAVSEQKLLLEKPKQTEGLDDDDKLNINHSSSDNNSSHYACAPIQEDKQLNNHALSADYTYSSSQSLKRPCDLRVELNKDLSTTDLSIPEERIYENAHKIMQHERPVYTNLEELRQQAAAAKLVATSPEPVFEEQEFEYELPVYENLFSLNEYDTLKKQKHNVNKNLSSLTLSQSGSNRNLKSPLQQRSPDEESA